MPVLELSPPVPTATLRQPLSPRKLQDNRSSSASSSNSLPSWSSSPNKTRVKQNTAHNHTQRHDENSHTRAGAPTSAAERQRLADEVCSATAATNHHEQRDAKLRDEDDIDVSMEMQSDDGGRGMSASGSGSSLATAAGDEGRDRVPIHVEVRLKPTSKLRFDLIRNMVATHLDTSYSTLVTNSLIDSWTEVDVLERNVDRVWIGECAAVPLGPVVSLEDVTLRVHVYQPPLSSKTSGFSAGGDDDDDGEGGDDVPAASVLHLPSRSLEGLWDTLVYDGDVKGKLLGYIYSTILFSDASVDFNIVTWNRVVLLHGPPGTGKTSLCRALAQKLAIRLSDRYDHGKLIEINSHSLFSKWFSESGKLVQRLFASVTDMVDDESCFVVVLIDEVESLTAARAGAMSGKEPSDALRVVNALLTQLDKLKHRKNVLVLTTSNLSAAIDGAFIDRADIKQYIGLPPPQAVYWILCSCLNEIMRAGLIKQVDLQDWIEIKERRQAGVLSQSRSERCSDKLYELAVLCQSMQMSGRLLRRLPVLAHARHIGMSASAGSSSSSSSGGKPSMETWLEAMEKCVVEEGEQLGKVMEGCM